MVQGFIGSTEDGATTTLGFEGSDFTATLVGSALNVSDIEIWKDVNGIMTADPSLLAEARTVKTISYNEAAELTCMGAKVLHPATIRPTRENNIPVHVFNSKEPNAPGTAITATSKHGEYLFKSIAHKRPVCLLRIASSTADRSFEMLRTVRDALCGAGIALIASVISDRNIVLAVDDIDDIQDLVGELEYSEDIRIEREMATVSLVGEDLGIVENAPSLILKKLDGIDVVMIVYGQTPISITYVIKQENLFPAIDGLHRGFLENHDQNSVV